jgi:hypothetical protein
MRRTHLVDPVTGKRRVNSSNRRHNRRLYQQLQLVSSSVPANEVRALAFVSRAAAAAARTAASLADPLPASLASAGELACAAAPLGDPPPAAPATDVDLATRVLVETARAEARRQAAAEAQEDLLRNVCEANVARAESAAQSLATRRVEARAIACDFSPPARIAAGDITLSRDELPRDLPAAAPAARPALRRAASPTPAPLVAPAAGIASVVRSGVRTAPRLARPAGPGRASALARALAVSDLRAERLRRQLEVLRRRVRTAARAQLASRAGQGPAASANPAPPAPSATVLPPPSYPPPRIGTSAGIPPWAPP